MKLTFAKVHSLVLNALPSLAGHLSTTSRRHSASFEISKLSPGLQREIRAETSAGPAMGGAIRKAWPFAYRAVYNLAHPAAPGTRQTDCAVTLPRFAVTHTDTGLREFLGLGQTAFNVLDLQCKGLELCWHSDLLRSLEFRSAIVSRPIIHMEGADARLEHLVLPVLSRGRLIGLRGWFDLLCGPADTRLDWVAVRNVTRVQRGRRVALPWRVLERDPTPSCAPETLGRTISFG